MNRIFGSNTRLLSLKRTNHRRSSTCIIESMKWRRAVKGFGSDKVNIETILQAIQHAPSSFGLQPYKIINVSSSSLLEALSPDSITYDNGEKIKQASNLLVFTARDDAKNVIDEFAKVSNTPEENIKSIRGMIETLPQQVFIDWSKQQVNVALGFALASAAHNRIPSCPMGGYDPDQVKTILKLDDNLHIAALMAIGSEPAILPPFPQFRHELDHLIVNM